MLEGNGPPTADSAPGVAMQDTSYGLSIVRSCDMAMWLLEVPFKLPVALDQKELAKACLDIQHDLDSQEPFNLIVKAANTLGKVNVRISAHPGELAIMNISNGLWKYLADHAPKLLKDGAFRALVLEGQEVPWEIPKLAEYEVKLWRHVTFFYGFSGKQNTGDYVCCLLDNILMHRKDAPPKSMSWTAQTHRYGFQNGMFKEFIQERSEKQSWNVSIPKNPAMNDPRRVHYWPMKDRGRTQVLGTAEGMQDLMERIEQYANGNDTHLLTDDEMKVLNKFGFSSGHGIWGDVEAILIKDQKMNPKACAELSAPQAVSLLASLLNSKEEKETEAFSPKQPVRKVIIKECWEIAGLPERIKKLAQCLKDNGGEMESSVLAQDNHAGFDPSRIFHDYNRKSTKDWIAQHIEKKERGIYKLHETPLKTVSKQSQKRIVKRSK